MLNRKNKKIMVNRVTYRRRVTYNTRSNKIRKVKTPGILFHYNLLFKKSCKVENLLLFIIKRKLIQLNVQLMDKL